jgi:hypothetical protein
MEDYIDPSGLTTAVVPDPSNTQWKKELVHGNCWPACDDHLDEIPGNAIELNLEEYKFFSELSIESVMDS